MTGNNPMSFFSDNVDAWGPLEWFDRLTKAVHARSRAVREKDDLSFELYQNIASSSATRLVSDFEDKVRMALTTMRELEKANVAYVDANTELLSTLESLQRENAILQERTADYPTISAKLHDREKARDAEQKSCREAIARAEAAEAEAKMLREALHKIESGYGANDICARIARDALSAQVQDEAGWQPIETAPKDKTPIIIAVPTKDRDDWIVGEGYFDPDHYEGGDWWWANLGYGDYHAGPISECNHWPPELWQPLPVPAAAPAKQEGGE